MLLSLSKNKPGFRIKFDSDTDKSLHTADKLLFFNYRPL